MEALFRKYLENKCSPEELQSLWNEFGIEGNEDLLRSLIIQELETDQQIRSINAEELEDSLTRTFNTIKTKLGPEKITRGAPVVPLVQSTWFRSAVAAV